ncbi:MAG: efflux RND transporter periplasmic adaptor subunit [Nitrospirota bacterium]
MKRSQNSEFRIQNSKAVPDEKRQRAPLPLKAHSRNSKSLLFFVLFWLLTSVMSGCSDKIKPGSAEVKRPVVTGITVTEVNPALIDDYYETSGTIKARTISMVASRVMGTVTTIKVREGDRVRAGQVLMTIDDRDSAQRVRAAEKALEAAEQQRSLTDITYQRYKKLYDGRAVSRQELDQIETGKKVAESEYERAKAMLAEIRINHGFSRITAPTSGVVTEKRIETGSMAVPGTPLLVVEDTSSYQLEAHLDESILNRISKGMPVTVIIESIGKQIEGRVVEIVPSVDPMSRTFLVKISVAGPLLKTGLYAKARIPVGKKEAIVVPERAVVEKGQLTGVYVVDSQGIISYRLVRLGRNYNGVTEIVSGLNPRDSVIIDGTNRAIDGGIARNVQRIPSGNTAPSAAPQR